MKNLAVSGALQKKISMAGLKLKKFARDPVDWWGCRGGGHDRVGLSCYYESW